MKKILAVIVWFLLPSLCYASPFLTCYNYPTTVVQPTHFRVSFDDGAYIDSQAIMNPDGSVKLWHDLASIGIGSHTVKAQACNIWGCSIDSDPFVFIRSVPDIPASMTIK